MSKSYNDQKYCYSSCKQSIYTENSPECTSMLLRVFRVEFELNIYRVAYFAVFIIELSNLLQTCFKFTFPMLDQTRRTLWISFSKEQHVENMTFYLLYDN